MNRHRAWVSRSWVVIGLLCFLLGLRGELIKTFHIKNPFQQANDMHIEFSLPIVQIAEPAKDGGHGGNKPKPGRSKFFDSGKKNNAVPRKADFKDGELPMNSVDDVDVRLQSNERKWIPDDDEQFRFIKKVEFTRTENGVSTVIGTLDFSKNNPEFQAHRQYVTGWTGAEMYDFADPDNVVLRILNSDPGSHLRYTLFDVAIYKDLPLGQFTIEDYLDGIDTWTPAFTAAQLTIEPGENLFLPFGPVQWNTYQLTQVGTVRVENVDTGEVDEYHTRQNFAETYTVPEPGSAALLPAGLAVLTSLRLCEKRARGG